jgi:VWFA-related protein
MTRTSAFARHVLAAIAIAACVALSARIAPADAQQSTPSVTINQLDADGYPELTAVVTVLDANGVPVGGLAMPAFTASDGAPVEITAARPALDASLSLGVVLVIDVSGSMEGQPLAAAKAAATAFVRQLDPLDEAAVVAFSEQVRTVQDFTQDREALVAAIEGLQAGGATSLYQAMQASVVAARTSDSPRHAVIVLSDGENDSTSPVTEPQSLDAARGAGVPVYTIGFGTGADPAYLQQLADASGGDYFGANTGDVSGVYDAIAQQLRAQYALTLRSAGGEAGSDAQLTVTVDVGGQQAASAPVAFTRGVAPPPPTQAPPTPAPAAGTTEENDTTISGVVIAAIVAVPVAIGAVVLFVMMLVRRRRQRIRDREAGRKSDAPLPPPPPGTPTPRGPVRQARLSGLTGEHAGVSFEFGVVPIVIGSDPDVDVRLAPSRDVAPKHAQLWVRDDKIMLRHLGGNRVTMAAGRPVDWLILDAGDELSVGPYAYRVDWSSSNGAASG